MLSEKLTGVRIRVLGALRRFWTDGGFAVDRPWLLAAIVAVGAYFRIVDLGINPAGFFCDEAWIGNTAMKLMETGRDDGGARWPLLFRAFAGWRTSSVVYPAIPLVALFGPSEFSVRLASALFGLASIYVVYLLGRELRAPRVGLVAATLLAVSPWHVHISRIAFDAHVCVFFACSFFYLLLRARKRPLLWPAAGLAYASFLFSYTASFLQAALLFVVVVVAFRRELRSWWRTKPFRWTMFGLGVPTAAMIGYLVYADMLFVRLRQTMPERRGATDFFSAMLNHFSYAFLAVTGESGFFGSHLTRHSIPGIGLLLPGQYFLFALGALVLAWRARYRPENVFLLATLLVFPIPAALVSDMPGAIRSVALVVPITVLSALGFEALLQRVPTIPRMVAGILALALLGYGTLRLHTAWKRYPEVSSDWEGWQHGYRDAIRWASQHTQNYDTIWVSHRFNAGEDLMRFYRVVYPCDNCRVMRNPIEVALPKREYFFARQDDIVDAKSRYPALAFHQTQQIVAPGGKVSLVGGYFEPATGRDVAGGTNGK